MINQYSEYPSFEYSEKSKWPLYALIGVIVLLVVVASFFVLTPKEKVKEHVCGDGICDAGENCYNCPADCKCLEGQYCSETEKCISPVCGNGVCEPAESSENCCNDCGCGMDGEICNEITHKCEIPASGISDEIAIELVKNYLRENEILGYEIVVGNDTIYEGKPAKLVYASPTDQKDWSETLYLVVTTDGNVHFLGTPI